jgi:hypothetical protein
VHDVGQNVHGGWPRRRARWLSPSLSSSAHPGADARAHGRDRLYPDPETGYGAGCWIPSAARVRRRTRPDDAASQASLRRPPIVPLVRHRFTAAVFCARSSPLPGTALLVRTSWSQLSLATALFFRHPRVSSGSPGRSGLRDPRQASCRWITRSSVSGWPWLTYSPDRAIVAFCSRVWAGPNPTS